MRLTLIASGALLVALVVGAFALTTVLSRTRLEAPGHRGPRPRGDDRRPRAGRPAAGRAARRRNRARSRSCSTRYGGVLATSPNASRTLPVVPVDSLHVGPVTTVGSTTVNEYDDVARVAARAVTYRGEPVTVVATVPVTEVRSVLDALRLALVVVVPAADVARSPSSSG